MKLTPIIDWNLPGNDRLFSPTVAGNVAEICTAGDGMIGAQARALKFTSDVTFGVKQLKINTNIVYGT